MSYGKKHPPRIEPLEPRVLLSGLSELQESATALAVSPPVEMTLSGSIDVPKGSDVYEFTTQATSSLIVDMFAEGGGLDPYLRLYDANGKSLRKNNNASRDTLDSRITYTLDHILNGKA